MIRCLPLFLLIACGDDTVVGIDTDTDTDCPGGVTCIGSLPFSERNDTSSSSQRALDGYSCSPSTDESGPEIVYQVELTQQAWLGVLISDGDGVDIDAHILSSLDAGACIDRGHHDAGELLDPGTYYVVADTYVSGGVEQSGAYDIFIDAYVPSRGSCAMQTGTLDRVGDDGTPLAMPATGPVVLEAHLVTVDDGFGSGWPSYQDEGIGEHYALSQAETGFVMARDQLWCPQEGCEYGQGAYGSKVPVEDEAWYVCMYWRSRPAPGTRMIIQRADGRAVVAAAGYETGPGDLSNVAGAVEEIHRYLGTGHGSTLTVGFAVDPSLPLGPILCE